MDKPNNLVVACDGGLDFEVSKIDYGQKAIENIIQIRQVGGGCINIPESWFKRMCDWYYENHVSKLNQ